MEISLLGSERARVGNRPGYSTLIRLAAVDFLTFARGPWDHDLMAPSGPPDPHWHGPHPRFQALLEKYASDGGRD